MKRLCLMMIGTMLLSLAAAQDLIITKDAKRIEGLVLEVSSTGIKYKMWENQSGPVFVLTAEELNSVIFQNGMVQIFDTKTQQAKAESMHIKTSGIYPYGDHYRLYENGKHTLSMDKDAYSSFIRRNCPEAWQEWQKSTAMIQNGYATLSIGIPLCFIVGIPVFFCAGSYAGYVAGSVLMAVGAANTAISIPLLAIGYTHRNQNYNIYNMHNAQSNNAISLNLQASTDGIGLALKF